jgi:hypothetical protein
LAIALLFLLPWRWYQTVYDPPGDNLLKLGLANIRSDEDFKIPFGKLLAQSYGNLSLDSYLSGKEEDVKILFTGNEWLGLESGNAGQFLGSFSNAVFFHLFWGLGVLNVGFVCRFFAKPSAARRFADQCLWIAAGAILFWILVIFPPAGTVIHNGSLANVLILFVPLVIYIVDAGLRVLYPLLAIQALVVFPLIVFAKPWVEAMPGALMAGPIDPGMALFALLSISSIAYIGWRVSNSPLKHPAPAPSE